MCEGWLLSIQEAKRAKIHTTGRKRRYITFVTLTLSSKQQHSDNQIKRELLNTFLIYCERKLNVQEWLWRAESQENGNIHFHLFLDSYIHYKILRQLWNKIQDKLDYVKEFRKLHKHSDPNSTDIERIKSVKGATIYVSKYIAKESKYRKIEGRIWGCSDSLRKVLPYECIGDSEMYQFVNQLRNEKAIKTIEEKHYSVYLGNIREYITRHCPSIQEKVSEHHRNLYKDLYKKKLVPS